MTAAFAVPGNTASTVLTRFFGSGLAGDIPASRPDSPTGWNYRLPVTVAFRIVRALPLRKAPLLCIPRNRLPATLLCGGRHAVHLGARQPKPPGDRRRLEAGFERRQDQPFLPGRHRSGLSARSPSRRPACRTGAPLRRRTVQVRGQGKRARPVTAGSGNGEVSGRPVLTVLSRSVPGPGGSPLTLHHHRHPSDRRQSRSALARRPVAAGTPFRRLQRKTPVAGQSAFPFPNRRPRPCGRPAIRRTGQRRHAPRRREGEPGRERGGGRMSRRGGIAAVPDHRHDGDGSHEYRNCDPRQRGDVPHTLVRPGPYRRPLCRREVQVVRATAVSAVARTTRPRRARAAAGRSSSPPP